VPDAGVLAESGTSRAHAARSARPRAGGRSAQTRLERERGIVADRLATGSVEAGHSQEQGAELAPRDAAGAAPGEDVTDTTDEEMYERLRENVPPELSTPLGQGGA